MKHKGRKTGSRLLASLLTAAMLITAPDISILAEPAAATETTETTVTAETALAETEVAEDPVMAAEMETETSETRKTENVETEEILPAEETTVGEESETSDMENLEDVKISGEEELETSEITETEEMESEPAEIETLTEEELEEEELEEESTIKADSTSPSNPVHHCTKQSGGSDCTDWSYVYFGSYPQSEVTGDALTSAITGAAYDSNGDAWVNGTKYRRISKSDTNNTNYFSSSTYRYFKWERIKWRVLQNDGNTLFVVADRGLDCKDYHDPGDSITWENCTLREWLNNDFYGTAFSSAEQGAVVEQTVVNEDNPYYNTEGGNNTNDKVYLLSIGEVTNPSYGFCEGYSTYSASRWMQTSDFAHARGAYTYSNSNTGGNANTWWWLRSPGYSTIRAACVDDYGYVDRLGHDVYYNYDAVVPALHINLSSHLWSLTDDGTSGEGGNGGVVANESLLYGALDGVDALSSTVTIDGTVYPVGEDFEMNRAEQIRQGDDQQVICIVSNEKIVEMDLKKDVVKPKLKLIPFNPNIEYKNGQYLNNKKQLSVNVEYSMAEQYHSILTSAGNAPKLSCDTVKLTLTQEGLNLGKDGIFQTSIMEKEWRDGIEPKPGVSYSATVDIYVEDDYVPGEVKVNFPVRAVVTSEGREYTTECEIPVANLDMQAEKTAAKKTAAGTDKELQQVFAELRGKNTLAVDSMLDYYLDTNQKEQVMQFLTAWIGTVMMSIEEEAETTANSLESKIVNKLFGKAGINTSTMLFMKNTQASVEVSAVTAKYGKRTFVFSLEMSSFSIGQGKPFGNKGDISYQLKDTSGISGGIPTSGVGMVTVVDFDNFVSHLQSAAESTIKSAYNEVWGKNANKAAEMVLNKTLMAVINKQYGSFSNGVYQLITKPTKDYVKKHTVKCPVDVYVYDSNGDLCGAIVDNQVDTAYNEVFMYVEDDAKYFYLTGDDYQVKLVGNDTGSMTYTVEECNGEMECLRTVEYQDVPLTDGKTYYSISVEPVLADEVLYDLISDTDELIQADIDDFEDKTEERIFVSGLGLDRTSCQVKEGEKISLSAKITPENATIQTVRWISSSEEIASVDENGTITAKKAGSATITAITYDGGLRADCVVTVVSGNGDNPNPGDTGTNPGGDSTNTGENGNGDNQNSQNNTTVKVKKLTISAPSKKIAAGKKVQLTAKITPKNATNKKVTWKSGNKKYATVNSKGIVTTKKAGAGKTVTITATAGDGSGRKASVKIKIMKNAVTKVKIKNAPKTLKAGKSVTLKTSVSTNGKSANKTLKWTSSNSKYATVNSRGKVTAKKAGKGKTVTITAASTDGTNKKAKVKIKIK